ncbi:MAG: CDP-diacylglycerol--glycerol-3-phosphate 3-phosphatidyltransferase [Candidatus Cloacimonetes bacterium]|nr:CDP-diacylglycerol--glycerol-3-phosphate 3-phosphatidyltransferase [Candidatus Cloacimonadota bacterium]
MQKFKRQIPNALTILRIILIPIFIYCALNDFFILTLIMFVVASLTDMFDGVIARKFGYVSNFGKIIDPLADKLLVASALIIFSYWGIVLWWLTAIILLREIFLTIYRELLKKKGIFLAANRYGKMKTTTQMVTIIATLAYRAVLPKIVIIDTILTIMYFLVALLAWMSAIIYIYQVRKERHET